MFGRVLKSRASWTLADQAVVSLGTFGANIIMARHLSPADYGVFAVTWGCLLLVQIANTALVSYPLTIQTAAPGADRPQLVASSLSMIALLMVPLSLLVACGLLVFEQGPLVLPVLVWFWCWQAQEALRRVLFSELRHRDAVVGDAVSYVGQVAAILWLAQSGTLTLITALAAMAATSLVAAGIQYLQIEHRWQRPRQLQAAAATNWTIGRWALASNFVTSLRVSALIWLIAVAANSSVAAEFQAALNVANFANPILFGLCNLIPAAAAHASRHGVEEAWRETRHFGLLGSLPAVAYYGLVVMWPETVLRIFYGEGSLYLEVHPAVRILGAAFLISFVTELICAFLHGINSARLAFNINLLGTTAVLLFAVPLILLAGWVGPYWALLLANVLRLAVAVGCLKQVISDGHVRTA
jgi:O-antigen/teichoic acid export membrane protein